MDKQLVKDIKNIYRLARKETCFCPSFERKLAHYIQRRAPEESVHWQKLRYEFRTVYRRCRDEQRLLKTYLEAMTRLTDVAVAGCHRQTELNVETLDLKPR